MFSNNYTEAREKFLDQVKKFGADLHSFITSVDLDGTALFTDIAILGDEQASNLIIISSGIHGVEGYSGSAIQCASFEMLAEKVRAEDVRIVLIHAINPHGMAYFSRFNANNIDLNRNCDLPEAETDQIVCDPLYDDLDSIMNSSQEYSSLDDFMGKLTAFSESNSISMPEIIKAIISGQNKYPEGIFYKGKKISIGLEILFDFLKALKTPELRAVNVLDLHTGIGQKGSSILATAFSLLTDDEKVIKCKSDLSLETFNYEVSSGLEHRVIDVLRMVKSDRDKFYAKREFGGNFVYQISDIFSGIEVNPFVLELGTSNELIELYCLVNLRWLKYHSEIEFGNMEEYQNHPIVQKFRESFYPSDLEWREEALNRGLAMCQGLINFALESSFSCEAAPACSVRSRSPSPAM